MLGGTLCADFPLHRRLQRATRTLTQSILTTLATPGPSRDYVAGMTPRDRRSRLGARYGVHRAGRPVALRPHRKLIKRLPHETAKDRFCCGVPAVERQHNRHMVNPTE